MKEEIKITDAVPEDARGIIEVLHRTWLATYPNKELGITIEDIEDSYKDSYREENIQNQERRIKELPINKKKIVAKQGDRIIGTATMIRNENNNELITLYVLPEFHGQGIGTRLWNEVEKFTDKSKDTFVKVATYNKIAINFYKKCGFVDTGKREFFEGFKLKSGAPMPEMVMKINAIR